MFLLGASVFLIFLFFEGRGKVFGGVWEGLCGGIFGDGLGGFVRGGAQPLSAEPKATREARGARRRRAGCARWLRLAGGGGKSKTAIPGAGMAAVIYGR